MISSSRFTGLTILCLLHFVSGVQMPWPEVFAAIAVALITEHLLRKYKLEEEET